MRFMLIYAEEDKEETSTQIVKREPTVLNKWVKNERVAQQWQARESTPDYPTLSKARTPSPSDIGKNLDSEKMQKIQHYQ
jgi:hypothetical protein